MRGTLKLGLQDAIALGIENNLEVEISRFDPPIARFEHSAAWGAFDPNLSSSFGYRSTRTPVANPLVSGNIGGLIGGGSALDLFKERILDGSASIRGLVPRLGWQYDVTYTGQDSTTTSQFQLLQPEFRTSLTGTATMPLLKGFLWGEPWVRVQTTGIGTGIARAKFIQQLMDTVRNIEGSYWNLAARKQDLAVALKSEETSRALLDQTRAQYQVGVVSKVEVVEAEAGLADREFQVITARNVFRRAQDVLLQLIFGAYFSADTSLEIVPTDRPEEYIVYDLAESEAAHKAFTLRPELTIARRQVDQQAIQLKFARNQRLPQIDLSASYGFRGLSGKAALFDAMGNPIPTPNNAGVKRDYFDSHDDFFRYDNRTWSAGVLMSIPIPNTSGRANVLKSRLDLRRSQTNVKRLEQRIILEVRNAIRNLRSALEGIAAAERGVESASEQLRAEQIRLEHGESTPFDVLLREQDATAAERKRITAYQVYHDSVAALDRAQGTILRDRNVVVEDALPLR